MRIVGGKYKGRTLIEFKGNDIRPTSDKARESIFNILQFKIVGATFLDLFCGTGAMGIEALSRGAKSVTFNDLDKNSLSVLKNNLKKLNVTESFSVVNSDALAFLTRTSERFDFIYIDPPYKSDLGIKALACAGAVLADGGTIILEDEKPFTSSVPNLFVVDTRKYGRIHLTFFQKEI